VTRRLGRPALYADFDAAAQDAYLEAVAAGERLDPAARKVGVHPNTPAVHASRDEAFAARFVDAKARGREARLDKTPHGESRYTNHGCHCDICRAAASAARTARRGARGRPDSPADAGSSLTPFSPRALSVDPAHRAA
jgi:hypothetical protein